MANRDSNIANFFETTLSASMGATDLTATVVTTSGGPASPCYVIIEPESSSQREIIYMDGTFTGTTFVTSTTANRYLDGSAASSGLTHPSGSVVWVAVLAQHLEDIHDRIDAVSDHGSLTGLADDDHTQYLNASRHDARDHSGVTGVAQIEAGSYTGDGTTPRTISVSFTPIFVFVVREASASTTVAFAFLSSITTSGTRGAAFRDLPLSDANEVLDSTSVTPVANGFEVETTTDISANTSGETYRWVAFG